MKKTILVPLILLLVSPPVAGEGFKVRRMIRPRKVSFEIITASWYGPGFHGRRTANGETYNMYKFTAAHTKLPFNTLIRIINPTNRRSIVVRINDRGPFDPEKLELLIPRPGVDLDLSYESAYALGIVQKGIAKLYARIISLPRPPS